MSLALATANTPLHPQATATIENGHAPINVAESKLGKAILYLQETQNTNKLKNVKNALIVEIADILKHSHELRGQVLKELSNSNKGKGLVKIINFVMPSYIAILEDKITDFQSSFYFKGEMGKSFVKGIAKDVAASQGIDTAQEIEECILGGSMPVMHTHHLFEKIEDALYPHL